VAKLLRIDRKLRTLNRRLTTDANGAPCCCQTSNQCPCDPSRPLRPIPYVTCVGGNFADSGGGSTLVRYSPPARVAVVRAQWQITQTKQTRSGIGTNYPVITDQVQRHQGQAQWCVIARTSGSTWSDYAWALNNATAAFEQQTVGNRIQPISVAETYEGNEALGYYPVLPNDRRGVFRTLIGPNAFVPNFFTATPIGIVATAQAFAEITLETPAYGDPKACNVSTNYNRTRSYGTLTQSRRFAFASNATQGAYTDDIVSNNPFNADLTRETSSVAMVYTTQYLTCTTGGDPTGSLIGEPGCSNCFDPSLLEPM
jgi:hypothetical protein